jgi:hypothetical protein
MYQVSPDPRPSGPGGWPAGPTPWSDGQGLRGFDSKLGCHASTRGGEARVGGRRSTQPANHVAWPPSHHLAPNRLLQVDGGPIHPYKYPPPLTMKVDTHHTLEIPLAKLSFLV